MLLNLAIRLFDRGIITVPYSTTAKKPVIDGGLEWNINTPTKTDFIAQWQKQLHRADGIAVMTGEIECLEGDTKNDPNGDIHDRLIAALKTHLGAAFNKLFIEVSPSGGVHIWYRVRKDEISSSQSMSYVELTDDQRFEMGLTADQSSVRTIVEIRAYMGLCTAFPSPGYGVILGASLRDGSHFLENLYMLTSQEREMVHMIARSFNEYEKPAVVHNYAPHEPNREGKRPGDYYNRDTSPENLISFLEGFGYRRLKQLGNSVFLSRPGAKHSNKHDAKVNLSLNLFVTYSSSIPEFEMLKGYNPFAVYTILKCSGDFAEATRQVAAKGFEDPEKKNRNYAKATYSPQQVPAAHVDDPFAEAEDVESVEDELAKYEHLRFRLSKRPKDLDHNLFFCDPNNDAKLQPVAGPGNIVAILGPAKSRKTTELSAIIAAALSGRRVANIIYRNASRVLWVDTEQGEYYFWETLWKVHVQSGIKVDTDNLYSYSLLDMSPKQRVQEIDKLIKLVKPSVVVIDGLVDLAHSMNDEKEAREIMDKLRVWTMGSVTVFAVLHFNPKSDKARGHLGTFLINKCDVAIGVFPDPTDKNLVLVKHVEARGSRFKAFPMRAGRDGILTENGSGEYDYTIAKPERVDLQEDAEQEELPPYNPHNLNYPREEKRTDEDIPF